uniref:ELM2 domain-containing protein n=1 Tax=Caenorhabditis japonica TaxID=281687 RepID=A0A8R1HL21_CAEJA
MNATSPNRSLEVDTDSPRSSVSSSTSAQQVPSTSIATQVDYITLESDSDHSDSEETAPPVKKARFTNVNGSTKTDRPDELIKGLVHEMVQNVVQSQQLLERARSEAESIELNLNLNSTDDVARTPSPTTQEHPIQTKAKIRTRPVKGAVKPSRRSSRLASAPDDGPETSDEIKMEEPVEIVETKPEVLLPSICEQQESKKKKVRITKPILEPSRRSGRINKENEQAVNNELFKNYNNGTGVINRGHNIPIGLTRRCFYFKDTSSDPTQARVKNQLKIDMQPPPSGMSKYREYTEEPSKKRGRKSREDRFMQRGWGEIRVGKAYQAEIPTSTSFDDDLDRDRDRDRDELVWSPPEYQKSEEEYYYETLRNQYWRAIWRQFESHIPMETALQHLMDNGYNMGKSLETIDQRLKMLPQVFKPMCMEQMKMFCIAKKNHHSKSLRNIQLKAMRNYHLAEVQQFRYRFQKFHKYQENHGLKCNCDEPLCQDLKFEPRWSCANCTKHLRPTSSSQAPADPFCLVCQTYQQLTGRKRPCKDVVFNDEELQKIEQWVEREEKEQKAITREELETVLKKETIARWKKNDLSGEEKEMLNQKIPKQREKIAEQLEPYVLPHFTKCNCKKQITDDKKSMLARRGPVQFKLTFSVQEQEEWAAKFESYGGNIHALARDLMVDRESVLQFLAVYSTEFDLDEHLENQILRFVRSSPTGKAPPLPDTTPSRDNSPYLPPDEKKGRAKKRSRS